MKNITSSPPRDTGGQSILAVLEDQLSALDAIGAHIAAAHLDAAIQHLRLDQKKG